jgi:hypothetical protein
MSPELRNLSPRVTSAAISAVDGRSPAWDCVRGREAARDVACGLVCSSSGGLEATDSVASGTRAAWAGAGVATGNAGSCFAGARAGRAGASAVGGDDGAGTRASCAGSGLDPSEAAASLAGSFAGASAVSGNAACGIGAGCGVAAIGGTLETIEADSAGAPLAGIAPGVDSGGIEASRVDEVLLAEPADGSPASLT